MVVIATVRTASSSTTVGLLRFAGRSHRGGGDLRCTATLEADGEVDEVDLEMIDAYRRMMLSFFEEVAELGRRDWSGEQTWQSESAELSVSAAPAGEDELTLDVVMRWPPNYETTRSAQLVVTRPSFEAFVGDLRGLLG
jgi:hypothetical protein